MFFIVPLQLPVLGQDWTSTIELRGRLEHRTDADFTTSPNDNASTLFSRGRVALSYKMDESTFGRLVYQFAGTNVEPSVGGSMDFAAQDLIEANIVRKTGGSTLSIGRQKVNIGGQRLVGALEWANSSRSWLGVRLESAEWGFFWGELESNPVPNPHAQIAVVSHKSVFGDTNYIYKHDTAPANRTSVNTVDHRLARSFGGVTLTAEAAYQWGRKGGLDHDAWAATVRADLGGSRAVNFYAEANIASGGGSASETRAFDNLYPTNHLYYGMMDLQGWSNMKGFMVGANWKASSNLTFDLSYHDFSLYDESDGWYGAGGAINRRNGVPYIDPSGTSGIKIGSEIDFVAKFRLNQNTVIEGGFAVFSPGEFIKNIVGTPTRDSRYGYIQVATKF